MIKSIKEQSQIILQRNSFFRLVLTSRLCFVAIRYNRCPKTYKLYKFDVLWTWCPAVCYKYVAPTERLYAASNNLQLIIFLFRVSDRAVVKTLYFNLSKTRSQRFAFWSQSFFFTLLHIPQTYGGGEVEFENLRIAEEWFKYLYMFFYIILLGARVSLKALVFIIKAQKKKGT